MNWRFATNLCAFSTAAPSTAMQSAAAPSALIASTAAPKNATLRYGLFAIFDAELCGLSHCFLAALQRQALQR